MFEIIRKGSKGKQVKKKYRIGTLRPLTKVSPHFTKSYYTVIKDFFKNLHNIIDTLEDDDIISISETIDTVHLIEFLDNIDITREYLFDVLQYNRNNDYTVSVIATINEYNKYNKTILPDYYSIMVEAYNDHNQDFLKRNMIYGDNGINMFITNTTVPMIYVFYTDGGSIKLLKHWKGNKDGYTVNIQKIKTTWLFQKRIVVDSVDIFNIRGKSHIPYIFIGDMIGDIRHIICMNHLHTYVNDIIKDYFEEGFLDILRESSKQYVQVVK